MTLKPTLNRPLIERLWQRNLPLAYCPLWAALVPLAALYGGGLAIRNRWWLTMSRHCGVPAVSVGNLTVGGNAKTPFTLMLAAELAARGVRVGIVSRGWAASRIGLEAALVSDGAQILLDPREAGDEPVMMAKSFAGPIAVARRRIDAINLLARRFRPDLVLLDDAFQHHRLRRDFDLLLVSEAQGFGNGWLLPAGPLREPLSAITRADAVVLISSGGRSDALTAAERGALERKPLFHAALRPHSLVHSEGGRWCEGPLTLGGRRVTAVSGLASAQGFHMMLKELGCEVAGALEYPDHHDYSPSDFENIIAAADHAEFIVTTEKDLVKLERFPSPPVPLYALRLEVAMDPGEETRLLGMVLERVKRPAPATRCSNPAG
jgi:tetraacyldisaccharide 4'-kinase